MSRRVAVAHHVLEFASRDPVAERALLALYHAAPATSAPATLRYEISRTAAGGYLGISPSRPPFGPARLGDVWAFLEWRVTEDLMQGGEPEIFLHAAGIQVGRRLVLLVGESGAGKSTLTALLLARGHCVLGDDLVRFAPETGAYRAVARSIKLDANSLICLPLLIQRCALASSGTFLAAESYYVSPAAIRRRWEASAACASAVILLTVAARQGPAALVRSSEGEAAVRVAEAMLGSGSNGGRERGQLTVQILESLGDVAAYRAEGSDPGALAVLIEQRLAG